MSLVTTNAITMKKPQRSILENATAARKGKRPVSTRPPSSGGRGNRLKTHITTLTSTPPSHILMKNTSLTPAPCSRYSAAPQIKPMAKLEPGPASATQTMSRLGLRKLP